MIGSTFGQEGKGEEWTVTLNRQQLFDREVNDCVERGEGMNHKSTEWKERSRKIKRKREGLGRKKKRNEIALKRKKEKV